MDLTSAINPIQKGFSSVISITTAIIIMTTRLGIGSIFASGYQFEGEPQRCERIQTVLCSDVNYNFTIMPNIVDQSNQRDAELQLYEFVPLINTKCSPWLKFFLCSVYFPLCTEQVDEILTIPPCRSMCLGVKEKCEPVLHKVTLKWPDVLDCGKLPEKNDRNSNLCIEPPPGYHDSLEEDGKNRKSGNNHIGKNNRLNQHGISSSIIDDFNSLDDMDDNDGIFKLFEMLKPRTYQATTTVKQHQRKISIESPSVYKLHPEDMKCHPRYINVDRFINRVHNDTCVPRCQTDVLYRHNDKRFAEIWIILWSTFCLLSTVITFFTFLLDTSRFCYPERPIIYLSICCMVYSCGYIIRFARGSTDISCMEARQDISYIVQEGLENTWCVVVFLILYYFSMAGCIWWVILTLTFYLSAGRKWSREALQGANSYFHIGAWTLPAVLTIAVLTMRRVDGDELTGLCFVGNQDMSSLVTFVLAPLMLYLIIGTFFIVAGFFAMFRIRHDLKLDGTDVKKFERLMVKIGIFSILYTLPATCVIGCLFYERLNYDEWKKASQSIPCQRFEDVRTNQQLIVDCSLEKSFPAVEVKVLKIFMSLVVGTASGIWVWSPKTVQTWNTFFAKICPNNSNKKTFTGEKIVKINSPSKRSGTIQPKTNVISTSKYRLANPNVI